jgi:hypothetical protein
VSEKDDSDAPATVRAGPGLLDSDVARLRDSVKPDPGEESFGGQFSLLGEAGSGGMGLVYEAIARDSGRRVAIKVITGLPSPNDRARFTAEAEVLERLDHPAIVDYVSHGVTKRGEPYLAMEWLVGESLTTRLARGAVSIADAVILGERVADALDHAHRAGVVHRDLKPSNIFLVDGKCEQAHLIDFGVAKVFDRDLTQTGQMIGTPGYMAPEQVRGEKTVDHRADLFSLGCVLYKALTGRAAFDGAEVMEVLARLLLEQPQPIEDLVIDTPPRLAHLVGSLLVKDPAKRLGDAAIACRELRAIREAIHAKDTTSLELKPREVPTPSLSTADTIGDTPRTRQRRRLWPLVAGGLVVVAAAIVVVFARGSSSSPRCDDTARSGCSALCKAGDADACFQLARTLHGNDLGIPIDHEAARVADTRACSLGNDAGCEASAVSLMGIIEKDTRDNPARKQERLAEIERLLSGACDRNFYPACRRLGKELSLGFGHGMTADPPRAFALVEKACDANEVAACRALRDMITDPNNGATPPLREQAKRVVAAACARQSDNDDVCGPPPTPVPPR